MSMQLQSGQDHIMPGRVGLARGGGGGFPPGPLLNFFYMGIYIHEIDTSLLKLTLLMRRKINIHYKE